MARAHRQRWLEAEGLRIQSAVRVSAAAPDLPGARADAERAARIAEELGLRPLLGRCQLALAQVARQAGDTRAHSHLEQAVALFSEMDMRYWLEQAEAERRLLAESSKG